MKHPVSLILLLIAVTCIIVAIVLYVRTTPPMDGYIDGKSYHPAYYPVDQNTPWVYCLGITSTDGRAATTWKVNKETYDSYNIGDLTGQPTNIERGEF